MSVLREIRTGDRRGRLRRALGRPRRRTVAIGGAGLAAVAVAGALVASGDGGGGDSAQAAPEGGTATVERRDLTERLTVEGDLGFAGEAAVISRLSGTVTWLPHRGQAIGRGERLFEIDEQPVVLMYGRVPAYRDLYLGVEDGVDVRQLERNLVALGYDPYGYVTVDEEFTENTAEAVERWQEDLGVEETGAVDLGQVVFLDGERRVSEIETGLGEAVGSGSGGTEGSAGAAADPTAPSGGSPASTEVMSATSTRRVVGVDLDAEDQAFAREGAQVTVTLPNGRRVDGRIVRVATSAEAASEAAAGSEDGEQEVTVEVTIRLRGEGADGDGFVEAPVTVAMERVVGKDVLAVPVTAIGAGRDGSYAVTEVRPDGTVRSVPVETGDFSGGYVEVSGQGVRPGMRVEVPE